MSEPEYNALLQSNIRRLIKKKGLKQRAVAEWCGLTDAQFSDLLTGRKILRADMLPRIATALGVGLDDLYKVEEATP